MVPAQRQKIRNTTIKIVRTIEEDETIQHCRINVVNGAKEIFKRYKDTLTTIDDGYISVRFYADHSNLYEDLFIDPDFMSHDWFNLFVFNIGIERETIIQEVCGVESVTLELRSKFDSRYYSVLIVSPASKLDLARIYEEESKEKCPITNNRYLGYDFDGLKILDYLNQILHTHSTQFLSRWAKALSKLEDIQKKPLNLSKGAM